MICQEQHNISIHALLAESDQSRGSVSMPRYRFLSTLSLRRATTSRLHKILADWDFYPRSPCGERHANLRRHRSNDDFYPRSPCGERPFSRCGRMTRPYFYPRSPCGERRYVAAGGNAAGYFYPRSPCGERQLSGQEQQQITAISIHALLAESDAPRGRSVLLNTQFLSTLSLRRATTTIITICIVLRFLSTLSLRRATQAKTRRT